MRGQSSQVRKHMDGLRWCGVSRMHHYDPGNIEHLYLVTFTLQQLFTLWPLTWPLLWIWPLSAKSTSINAKMEFGLFTPTEPHVSCVTLNMWVFVKQRADRKRTRSLGFRVLLEINKQLSQNKKYTVWIMQRVQLTANNGWDFLFENSSYCWNVGKH